MTNSHSNLPDMKQTMLGLYVTAKEAFEQWQAKPKKVKIIDVRTPEEFLYVGHPTMAWKVPAFAQTYQWDAEKEQFPMRPLPDFLSRITEFAKPDDTLMVMCRSGGRSAMAVNMLAQSGFTSVYNIIDGMEGDKVDDAESVFHEMPMRNGWKNSSCPWTCNLTPERLVLPSSDPKGA